MTEVKMWFGTDNWPRLGLEQDTIVYCNGYVLYTDDTITFTSADDEPKHAVVLTRNTVIDTNGHRLVVKNQPEAL